MMNPPSGVWYSYTSGLLDMFLLFFLPPLPVCHKLELERQQHNQLKHTWQRANDQFLESQRLLMRDMQRIESVLSSEQLRQVEVIKKKDQVAHTHAHIYKFNRTGVKTHTSTDLHTPTGLYEHTLILVSYTLIPPSHQQGAPQN